MASRSASPFGPMYLIYTKGAGTKGQKVEIRANRAEDPHMKKEPRPAGPSHPLPLPRLLRHRDHRR